MECERCGGLVTWRGPMSALTHTQCESCGGINCQIVECGDSEIDTRDPEMCIHALSVNEDRDLLCCKGARRTSCDGPCADFVDAFPEEAPN